MRLLVRDPDPQLSRSLEAAEPVQVWKTAAGESFAFGYVIGENFWLRWPGFGSYRFHPEGPAGEVFPEGAGRAATLLDTWRRTVVPLVLVTRGSEVLHASAVVVDGGVVALTGTAGTGKSTVAYALRSRGLEQWADDAVVVERTGSRGAPTSRRLPFSPRLLPDTSGWLPSWGGQNGQSALPDVLPLRTVCRLSRLAEGAPGVLRVSRVKGAAAVTSLLTDALTFDSRPDRHAKMLETYLGIAGTVPVYSLAFRPGPANLTHVLDELTAFLGSIGQ